MMKSREIFIFVRNLVLISKYLVSLFKELLFIDIIFDFFNYRFINRFLSSLRIFYRV